VVTIVADGTGTLIGIANTQKELAARVGTLLSGKGPTLAARQELAGFRQSKVNAAQFSTLLGILEQFGVETRSVSATLPHRGGAPVVGTFEAEAGSAPTGRGRVTRPSARPRTAMSRSEIAPIMRSFSPTGIMPKSPSRMHLAASAMVASGLMTCTSRLMMSLI
jgi:hypothetical protein